MTSRPITVLDLRDSPWVDGPGRTILQTASMTDPAHCRILVGGFCGENQAEDAYLDQARDLGLEVYPIRERSTLDYGVVRQIREILRRANVDILHSHDFRSLLYGLACSRLSGVPLVATCHGWIANDLKGRVYTALDRFLLRFATEIITVSDRLRQQLLAGGTPDGKITVIPNALIVDDYQPDRDDRRFRRELGLPDELAMVVNIGRLSPEKGQDLSLQATGRLLDAGRKLALVLIGIGPEEKRLRAMAADLGIDDNVVFAGYRKDMAAIYNSSDLVVQSSHTEGMPNVILEALLMQVPVIATDVGGTREVVQDNFSGAVIPPAELDLLVERMNEFFDRREHYRDMARSGRQYVREHFDHRHRVTKTVEAYQRLLDRGRKPS